MNKRNLGNKLPKKKSCLCLALHKEVNEYWNVQQRKPDNEEEKSQETEQLNSVVEWKHMNVPLNISQEEYLYR